MDLKVGDKVLCTEPTGYLVEGQTYTVSALFKQGTTLVGITVNECHVQDGYKSYITERFSKAEPQNIVAITSDDLEAILDAFIALDYYSEGTYINLANYSRIVDKIEGQIKTNEN